MSVYYLSLDEARLVVDGAREAAAEAGDLRMAPPMPLDDCKREIVESALAGPQEGFGEHESYPTLAAKAGVLAYRCIKGHACGDGNKRLGLILSVAFLEANGQDLETSGEETDHVFRHVAASAPEDYDGILKLFTHWFEQSMRPLAEEE